MTAEAVQNPGEATMLRAWTIVAVSLIALAISLPNQLAAQGKGKGIRLWNLTTATISGFQLSPAGKTDWGPNQTLNDKDDAVFSIADKDLKDCNK
jgi:hypothetical protein